MRLLSCLYVSDSPSWAAAAAMAAARSAARASSAACASAKARACDLSNFRAALCRAAAASLQCLSELEPVAGAGSCPLLLRAARALPRGVSPLLLPSARLASNSGRSTWQLSAASRVWPGRRAGGRRSPAWGTRSMTSTLMSSRRPFFLMAAALIFLAAASVLSLRTWTQQE